MNVVCTSQDRQPDPLFAAAVSVPPASELNNPDALMPQWAMEWAEELNASSMKAQCSIRAPCSEATSVHAGVSVTDVPRSSQSTLANAPDDTPAWAFQWASEIEMDASACLKPVTDPTQPIPAARLRPRSPANVFKPRPKPSSAPHIHNDACKGPAQVTNVLDLVKLGAKEAAKQKAVAAAEEEYRRFISDSSPLRDLDELATFLMKFDLYGPPHNIRLIQSRGKPCGILVQPCWGRSLGVYLKTGKMNLQGPLHARSRMLNLVKHATQKSRPSGAQDGLPDPVCIRARLLSG